MKTSILKNKLDTLGVVLSLDGENLKYKAPKGIITEDLLAEIKEHKAELIALLHEEQSRKIPLNPLQQQLLFLEEMHSDTTNYNAFLGFKIIGELDKTHLESAINSLVQKHEILRTVVVENNTESYLKVKTNTCIIVDEVATNVNESSLLIEEFAQEELNFNEGVIFKVKIFRETPENSIVVLLTHHLFVDGWSLNIIANQLWELYENPNKDLPKSVDLVNYEINRQQSVKEKRAEEIEYWKRTLANINTELELPYDSDADGSYFECATSNTILLNATEYAQIKALGQETRTSTFMIHLTALQLTIQTITEQNNFVLSTAVSQRNTIDVANTVGQFSNTLLLKCKTDERASFLEHLSRMKKTCIEAFSNANVPYHEVLNAIQKENGFQSDPIQIMVVQQNGLESGKSLPSLSIQPLNIACGKAKFDIGMYLLENDEQLSLLIEYRKDVFLEETINLFIEHYRKTLQLLIKETNFLPTELVKKAGIAISHASKPANTITENTFHGAFEKQVEKEPLVPAIKNEEGSLTYEELNKKANQWARSLLEKGIQKGDCIGLGYERTEESIIALLAILKIGAAYVPVDIDYPIKSQYNIFNKTEISACILSEEHAERTGSNHQKNIFYSDLKINSNHLSDHNLEKKINTEDTVYIIHTSGSTGIPKGVEVSHRNIVQLAKTLQTELYNSEDQKENFSLNGSLAFDTSVKQLCGLLFGGCLTIIPQEVRLDGNLLNDFIQRNAISVFDSTPSQWSFLEMNELLQDNTTLKYVLFGGERIEKNTWNTLASIPYCTFHNLYGLTECTVDSTHTKIVAETIPSIGKVLPGTEIYLLNKELKPIPKGAIGELYIGGTGITKGYWNDITETANRFIEHPFEKGKQLYRTGDKGKMLDDGTILYTGRVDSELKIRGHRFKPSYIQNILEKHLQIAKAIVVSDANNKEKLYVYIQSKKKTKGVVDDKEYQLPNGLAVSYLNTNETAFLYKDIFENNAYLKFGIEIPKDACVLDVGANIGMFAMFIKQQNQEATVYSFEPNPIVFEKLQSNINKYEVKGKALNYGLAEADKIAEFTFYPKFSFLSGLYADDEENKEMVRSYIRKTEEGSKVEEEVIENLLEDRFQSTTMEVNLKTLSSFIASEQLTTIDLLKINVEKSEVDVLKGIEDKHWEIIKNLVFEYHNTENELEQIVTFLETKKFDVIAERDWSVDKKNNIYYIYASKQKLDRTIVSEKVTFLGSELSKEALNKHLSQYLPAGILPSEYEFLDEIPLTKNGKIDLKKLKKTNTETILEEGSSDEITTKLKHIWYELLGTSVSIHSNFFEVGGHSLLLMKLRKKIKEVFEEEIPITLFFDHTTIAKLAILIKNRKGIIAKTKDTESKTDSKTEKNRSNAVAVIGMSLRFPGANSVEEFWNNLTEGKETISNLSEEQMGNDGVPEAVFKRENYVNAAGVINEYDCFDANFFNYSKREATITDPQQRLLLEHAWEALEHAGYAPNTAENNVGVFVGSSINSYMIHHIDRFKELMYELGSHPLILANDKDHLGTHIAYKLNLTGPAVTVQTACSTSLTAIHTACKSILDGTCEMVLAGGVSVRVPHHLGYAYQKGGILSSDGHCRAFDKNAEGTVPGSGVGVVVLKRLEDAIRDKDTIHSVILGSAINNDGGQKMSYTAPSVSGQAKCIKMAYENAGISPASVSYIEAHGTGTNLGDPIEIAALQQVFQSYTKTHKANSCAIGSVKSNIGHLDAAAGVAGFIKTVLSLKHKTILPSLHFSEINEEIQLENSPFYINNKLTAWNVKEKRASVSSFGLGGTNAHVILEAYEPKSIIKKEEPVLLIFSAKTKKSLLQTLKKFQKFLAKNEMCLQDVAYTLQVGRKAFEYRYAIVAKSKEDVLKQLQNVSEKEIVKVEENIDQKEVNKQVTSVNIETIDQIKENWLSGEIINWNVSYKEQPYRISLPTYSFERKRFWLESTQTTIHTPKKEPKNEVVIEKTITEQITAIWEQVLGEKITSVEDDFFELGGNSLLAIQVLVRIKELYNVEIEVYDFFEEGGSIQYLVDCIEAEKSNNQNTENKSLINEIDEEILDDLISNFNNNDLI